jgi:V/A-type H+-transporting ATPase subunit K
MTGLLLALLGAVLAVAIAGFGSILGVGVAGVAADAIVAEEPEKFGKCLVLQALPGTQGIYGFLGAILVISKLGLFSGNVPNVATSTGWLLFAACMPVALGGFLSGVYQGKVSAAAMAIVAKNEQDFGKGMVFAAMVETYAVIGLVATILMINGIKL